MIIIFKQFKKINNTYKNNLISSFCFRQINTVSRPFISLWIEINYPKIYTILLDYAALRVKIYAKIVDKGLTYFLLKPLILSWFSFLFWYRYVCDLVGKRFNQDQLNLIAIILSITLSRLGIAGYLIVAILMLTRLELSYQAVSRYYRNRLILLPIHFPSNDPRNQRRMHRIAQIILDAAQNPTVQATATAVGGALAWKSLDVWDSHKASKTADKDRAAAMETADKDRTAAIETADKDREKMVETANKDREKMVETANKDREKMVETANKDREKMVEIANKDRAATIEAANKDRAVALEIAREASETADKDREAEDRRHREQLDAGERHHKEQLEAEDRRHREQLDVEDRQHQEQVPNMINANSDLAESNLLDLVD